MVDDISFFVWRSCQDYKEEEKIPESRNWICGKIRKLLPLQHIFFFFAHRRQRERASATLCCYKMLCYTFVAGSETSETLLNSLLAPTPPPPFPPFFPTAEKVNMEKGPGTKWRNPGRRGGGNIQSRGKGGERCWRRVTLRASKTCVHILLDCDLRCLVKERRCVPTRSATQYLMQKKCLSPPKIVIQRSSNLRNIPLPWHKKNMAIICYK